MPNISLRNVTCIYQNKHEEVRALDDLSIEFKDEKISSIIGISGAGKTTLLKVIAGTIGYNGDIYYNDVNINSYDVKTRNVSYVSQEIALYPHLNVFQNIAFPLSLTNALPDEIRSRVYDAAKMLQIENLLSRKPRQISIGQAQRVAIARAIIKRPNVYLFDEIFSNLDYKTTVQIRVDLKKVLKSLRATAIFVTHDVTEALALSDYIYVIEDGKLVEEGSPMDIYNSKNERVRDFFRSGDQNVI